MTRLKDLEDQTEQHSRVQEKMTERLKMMDDHAQHQGQQVNQDFLLLEEWSVGVQRSLETIIITSVHVKDSVYM